MKMFCPKILRRIDRYLLLNHPVPWIAGLHWALYFWLVGLALIVLSALALPVTLSSIRSLNLYFLAALAPAISVGLWWAFIRLQFNPQRRNNFKTLTEAYLLGGYFLVLLIYLAWPYIFTGILKARIASLISEEEIVRDLNVVESNRGYREQPDWRQRDRDLSRLALRYKGTPSPPRNPPAIDGEIEESVYLLCESKGISLGRHAVTQKAYIERLPWIVALILWLALSLLIGQAFPSEDLGATFMVLMVVAFAAFFIFAAYEQYLYIMFWVVLGIFLGGGGSALRVSHLKKRSALLAVGLNIFTFLLMWVPVIIWLAFSLPGKVEVGNILAADPRLLLVGSVLLFLATPWIQRRYMDLYAKPS